jgi:hypothetical protein
MMHELLVTIHGAVGDSRSNCESSELSETSSRDLAISRPTTSFDSEVPKSDEPSPRDGISISTCLDLFIDEFLPRMASFGDAIKKRRIVPIVQLAVRRLNTEKTI